MSNKEILLKPLNAGKLLTLTLIIVLPSVITTPAYSRSDEGHSTVYVKDTVMATYPFSNPDPVPHPGKLWPYWRFLQFSTESEQRTWTMVILENRYLRVKVFPEIGGKIWSVFDKTSGKEMFYDNDAVKFRDISLRGPWTSGGIEFNYGIIGHAPTCAHPVDWMTETKEDGSASCHISAQEMLSQSRWTIEINLPDDAVWLRTTSVWHNGSPEYQPYYSWANSAVKASEDMMLVYPAVDAVGHWGEALSYPIDGEERDIRYYRNQAYGADKSYHMVGTHKSFFGVYYADENRGVMHYSLRDEKLGRKYYSWAQSEQGNIWVDLLTDSRPQYVELQSGRLFNQNYIKCSETSSYRQFLFSPYGTDIWSDYWIPCEGIGPADEVNLNAVISVTSSESKTGIGIYPLRKMDGSLQVIDSKGKMLFDKKTALAPAKALAIEVKGEPALIKVGEKVIWRAENGRTDRPRKRNEEFDSTSVKGKLLIARDMFGMKMYSQSEEKADSVLAIEPGNIDALTLKAQLLFHRMDYAGALSFADKAIAIDQYNPDAGYVGGTASASLGRIPEAMDRFEVAAICNSPLRTACYTELARLHFIWGDKELASDYARKALSNNADNITAMFILYKAGGGSIDALAGINPLSHLIQAEKMLSGEITPGQFAEKFRSELPWEDYLELAVQYSNLGLKEEASAILSALPKQNALTALWIAWLKDDKRMIAGAEQCGLDFVFPFRRESGDVLGWALDNGGKWQSKYLMAMLQDYFCNPGKAASLLNDEETGFAPYYAYRYKFSNKTEDIRKAFDTDPQQFIYLHTLGKDLLQKGKAEEAVDMLSSFYSTHPDAIQIGDILMDAYIAVGRYTDAEKIVDTIRYLPFEGQHGSHDRYRMIKLNLATEALEKGDLERAERLVEEALEWPARLGAGKPYDDLIDTSDEKRLKDEIMKRRFNNGTKFESHIGQH